MVKACPISIDSVDKYLIKAYAGIVILFLVLFLIGFRIPFLFITVDFLIRVVFGIKHSPSCFFLRFIFSLFHVKPKLINAGPKKFAANVGLTFSLLVSFSFLANFILLANIIASMFLLALLLEVIVDYCLACKLQSIYLSWFK